MKWREIRREAPILLKLAWPIVVGQVGQMCFGLIDVVMVGRVGTIDLAAISFANSVYVVFLVFGLGVSNSTSPLVSRSLGRDDLAGAARIMKNAVRVNVFLGAILTAAAFVALLFFDQMGQEAAVAEKSRSFFALICLTLIPAMLYQCLKQLLESIGHAKAPMFAMVFGLGLNVLLNAVLIFGWGLVPPLGIVGAAVATIASRTVMLAIVYAYVRRARRLHEFREAHRPPRHVWDRDVVTELLKLGIPSGLVLLFEIAAFTSAALMMGWLGSVELASHQVALSLAALSFMVPLGLSFAAGIRVGLASGRDDPRAARTAGLTGILVAATFMGLVAVIFASGRDFWPTLFSEDPAVRALAAQLLVVAALFQLFDGIQVVAVGSLRALKDVRWPLAITVLAYWVIALPSGYVMAFHRAMGPLGIWYGLFGGLVVAAVLLTTRFVILLSRPASAH